MTWDRLIRFSESDGRISYGEPDIDSDEELSDLTAQGALYAYKVSGEDIFTAEKTHEKVR